MPFLRKNSSHFCITATAWPEYLSWGLIEEIHGKPVKAVESFSAAHIVGFFDTIDEMHWVYDRYKGHTALSADSAG